MSTDSLNPITTNMICEWLMENTVAYSHNPLCESERTVIRDALTAYHTIIRQHQAARGDVVERLTALMGKCPLGHDIRDIGTVSTVWALAIQAAIAAMNMGVVPDRDKAVGNSVTLETDAPNNNINEMMARFIRTCHVDKMGEFSFDTSLLDDVLEVIGDAFTRKDEEFEAEQLRSNTTKPPEGTTSPEKQREISLSKDDLRCDLMYDAEFREAGIQGYETSDDDYFHNLADIAIRKLIPYFPTHKPASVSLNECVQAIKSHYPKDWNPRQWAKAVLESLKAQGVQFDVKD